MHRKMSTASGHIDKIQPNRQPWSGMLGVMSSILTLTPCLSFLLSFFTDFFHKGLGFKSKILLK